MLEHLPGGSERCIVIAGQPQSHQPSGVCRIMQASAQVSMESSTGRVFEGPAAIPTAGNLAVQDQNIASAGAGGAETSISREKEEQMGALRAQGQMLGARKVEL